MNTTGPPDIDGYRDLEPIGRGGVGDVYRAVRAASGATVAIKVLRDVTDESAAWRRCRRELSALLALSRHAHVVAIVEVALAGVHPALVTEYAPDGSVADLVARRGAPLTPAEAARLGGQAADALAEAHRRGIVHRDVKPHNLLLDPDGNVKLCDFGIAAIARSPEFRHATATVSLRFASPEDLDGDGSVGPPADVYSLGATLLYLVRGQHLDLRDRLVAWRRPADRDEPDLLELDAVIADCLQPDPDARPTAVEIAERLMRLSGPGANSFEHTVPRPMPGPQPRLAVPPRPSPAVPRPRRRRALAASVVAVAALAGIAAIHVTRRREPAPVAPAGSPARLVDRPSGLVELTALTWPQGAPGECLVQRPGRPALHPVDCDEPHDLERVGHGSLPGGLRFDTAAVDAAVDAACAARAIEFAGAAPAGNGLAVAVTQPSSAGWSRGDRAFQCYVGAPDRRIAGTAAQAG